MIEIVVGVAFALLYTCVGIAGACAALFDERPAIDLDALPTPKLDRDAPLDWSEKAPDPRTGALMSRLAKEGMAVLAKERAQ